jgi:hypothetical protein
MRLLLIPTNRVEGLWYVVTPLIEDALRYADGDFAPADVLDYLREGRMQMWVASKENGQVKGVAVTQVVGFPQRNILQIVFGGGEDLDDWLPLQEEMATWAKTQGVKVIEINGRRGMARKLGEDWKMRWATFRRYL